MERIARKLLRRFGFDLVRYTEEEQPQPLFPPDFDDETVDIIRRVTPYTMTSVERLFALIQAVKYVVSADIPGGIVESGAWLGGSMMAVAHTLKRLGSGDRDLYLFDTYEGMPRPTELDVSYAGTPASIDFERTKKSGDTSAWCYASIEQVRSNLISTGYDTSRLHLIKGKVEETIPDSAPSRIALLRLDTDWYESTRHELIHLYPRLSAGGVLIVDDYGHWRGSRKAVDEYVKQHNISILFNRIDYTGRIAVRP